jgi:hypothetical protein
MDDFSGLAGRVATGVGGLRGCLILSRDGLVLGAHPDDDESVTKPSWLRFATMGEPERSFVEFPVQVWVYVRRGPYAAFAVAEAGVRPGLVIDQLEQALLMAEESRTKREGLRGSEAAPAAGPRTPLHPAPAWAPAQPPVVAPVAVPASVETTAASPGTPIDRPAEVPQDAAPDAPTDRPGPPDQDDGELPDGPRDEAPTEPDAGTEPPKHEPPKLMTTPVTPNRATEDEEEGEVDRVLLAQEFSGLLQDLGSDDEGSS